MQRSKRAKIGLGARLEAVGSLVLQGEPLIDVGCDSALLASDLVQRGVIPRAIASDNKSKPLQYAAATLGRQGTADRVQLRLGDGLSTLLETDRVKCVSISGMGGNSIVTVLEQGPLFGVKRAVLLPSQSNGSFVIRRYLAESKWQIVDEQLVEEGGRYYVVIAAERCEQLVPLSELDVICGPILRERGGEMYDAWKGVMRDLIQKKIAGLKKSKSANKEELLQAEQQKIELLV